MYLSIVRTDWEQGDRSPILGPNVSLKLKLAVNSCDKLWGLAADICRINSGRHGLGNDRPASFGITFSIRILAIESTE